MSIIQDILTGARDLIVATDWCQGQYAMKNGKTFYDYTKSDELADAYSVDGALTKIASNMCKAANAVNDVDRNKYWAAAYYAGKAILKTQGWNGILADWNDQNPAVNMLDDFTAELKAKNLPRDKAKVEINTFKQKLKTLNIQPILTKGIVIEAITNAIDVNDQQIYELWQESFAPKDPHRLFQHTL